jgi:hypothetical protein
MPTMKKLMMLAALVVLIPGSSFATVITVNNPATFNALGTIAYNSNFIDFGTGFGFLGDPFTRGDVTYHSTQNLTWGSSTPYTTTEPLIGNNYWTPILGDIATGPQYDMFGFDIGTYNSSPITLTVFTNLGSYVYPSQIIADSNAGLLEFRGFVASGEYFTGFDITADAGVGNLPGITNVKLGNTGIIPVPVPEPASLALFGAGLAGLAIFRRRRKAKA